MWEIQNPMKTQSLPRRYSEKFGSVSVKTNYRSYRDYLQSFNESRTGSRDDQESLSSADSGISSYTLSESKSANSSSCSVSSDLSTNSQIRKNEISFVGVKPYKEFLENYSTKKFSPVKPTLPEKKNIKSEIYIEVVGVENGKNGRNSAERLDVTNSNGSVSPKENGIKTNVLKLDKTTTHKLPPNGIIAQKTNTEEIFKRSNGYSSGRTVETIKKFNDLSKKDQPLNGTLGKTKSRAKPDVVPERSSFINGRTSPFTVQQEDNKLEQLSPKSRNSSLNGGKVVLTKSQTLPNDYKSFGSSKNLNDQAKPNTKIGDQTDCAVIEKFETNQRKSSLQNGSTKFSANVWQISEELNKINARLLNGNISKIDGHQNGEKEKGTSSSESLSSYSSNEFLNHDETLEKQVESTFEIPVIQVESPQEFSIPPPPPPPPPMLVMDSKTSSSSSPRKWSSVKTDCEQAQTSKPKETNQAAMNLAKVLIEGTRKLRKTKSFGDELESNGNGLQGDYDNTHKTQQNRIPSTLLKPISPQSLTDRSQPVLTSTTTTTTPNHITNDGGSSSSSHNNYRENKERTSSPPKKIDVQPLKSIYNGQSNANGRVPVMSSTLRRTMSGSKIESTASILEANAKTVIPVADRNAKIEKTDPNVKKMVYNTYRGLLGAYNPKANGIIATLPRNMVREDQGVTKQLESIALQGGLDKLNGRVNPNPDKD
ncbi:serine/threonine-protein kinase HSL1-like [Agrilus planipennis]|uniref:Serine/threonine-protein kinase HSL1-like n=1 Tax=Agrilus planipennis TaxID=224129 RepID=A0A1W4WGT5_AGRPL|nr:serine/threonine-protein kinase HSL1-like [Agrilus planipennis]